VDAPQSSVFPLRPTVEEALALLRAIVPASIDIVFDPQEDDSMVSGDVSLLHQVVINLCTNGYQAMRRSGGSLGVRLRTLDNPAVPHLEPGRYAVLEVSDSGHGMDEAVMAHIFEPFFTTRGVGEGTGLGLSVVHGIVTSMGGAITVESAISHGTTFRVYLPAVAEVLALTGSAQG
jgi:signal transduction histidine kinase